MEGGSVIAELSRRSAGPSGASRTLHSATSRGGGSTVPGADPAAERRAPTQAGAGAPQGAAEAPVPALPWRSVDSGSVWSPGVQQSEPLGSSFKLCCRLPARTAAAARRPGVGPGVQWGVRPGPCGLHGLGKQVPPYPVCPSPSILLRLFPQDHSPPALAAVLTRGIFSYWAIRCCHAPHPPGSAQTHPQGTVHCGWPSDDCVLLVTCSAVAFCSQGWSTERARLSPH